jgi:8-oxo-dGTP pyrophosphatase MutT (NUDIX family)
MGATFSCIELELYADFDLTELGNWLAESGIGTNNCGPALNRRSSGYSFAGSFLWLHQGQQSELRSSDQRIDLCAAALCRVLEGLPPGMQQLWAGTTDRVFDIGLDADFDRRSIVELVSSETMARMAALGVRLAVSVYTVNRLLPLRVGAYALVVNEGANAVLMCHTTSGSRVIRNFPGGRVEQGENLKDALLREFEEEVGGKVDVATVTHFHSSDGSYINPDYPGNRMQCHYYLVQILGDIPLHGNDADVKKLEWVPLAELPKEDMLSPDIEVTNLLKELFS